MQSDFIALHKRPGQARGGTFSTPKPTSAPVSAQTRVVSSKGSDQFAQVTFCCLLLPGSSDLNGLRPV